MATNVHALKIRVKVAWWLKLYFYALATTSAISGREPDWNRVKYWINKGVSAKVDRDAC
ncbi:MAG: hypothetical protein V4684_19380 [Pseudomonadota bacterium]